MSEDLKKRLLQQAGIAALAGLLMSSAVMAEDMGDPPEEVEVEITVDAELGDPAEGVTLEIEAPGGSGDPADEGVVEDGEVIDGGCIECSGGPDIEVTSDGSGEEGPDVFIDPIEMEGVPVGEEGEPIMQADGEVGVEAQSGGPSPREMRKEDTRRERGDNAVPLIRTIFN